MTTQQATPRLIIAGRIGVLQSICTFCRKVYHSAFGPEEGEQKYLALTLVDAVALWEAGLPDSRLNTH